MHLKRFRAKTVAAALEAARTELGADALVLGTRLVPCAGWRGFLGARDVEVTAAAERQVSEPRPERQRVRHPVRQSNEAMHAQLCAAGLDRGVVDEIAASLGRRLLAATPEEVRNALTSWTAAITADDVGVAAIEVVVGPSGGGKTTTVAKLAAHAVVTTRRRVGMVSAEASPLGVLQPLRVHAEMRGLPFVAARSLGQLAFALTNRTDPVVVDTAGSSPEETPLRDVLTLIGTTPGARVHLVVPADISSAAFLGLLDTYRAVAPTRVIFTKMDDGGSLAPLAGAIRRGGVRVSYLSTGPGIWDDLHRATPALMAAALVGDSLVKAGHAA